MVEVMLAVGINLISATVGWFAGLIVSRYWNPVRWHVSPYEEGRWEVSRLSGPRALDVQVEGASFRGQTIRTSNRSGLAQWDLMRGESIAVSPIDQPGVYRLHWIERGRRRYFDLIMRAGVFNRFEVRRRDIRRLTATTQSLNLKEGRFAKG